MSDAQLTSRQKAAAVIVALGADVSSKIYKYLDEDELELLTYEIARLSVTDHSEVESTLSDFNQLIKTQKVVSKGGLDFAKGVLEKAYGAQKANSLMDRTIKSPQTKEFESISKVDYKNLLAVIQNEHLQTMALILSYARADQAASVIAELPADKQIEVVERIATMDRASPEVIKIIEKNLAMKFASVGSTDFMKFGGVNSIADIMNQIDRTSEKSIFEELSRRDEALAEEIRKKMFVFEDITLLDDMSIQRFLREVDAKDLVYSLKGANPEVTSVIFKNMSARMSETIRSDLEYTRNVRLSDVQDAQQRIVGVIRRLESEGELLITKGGKDEIIE